jgi:hypothetical protein
MKRTAYLVAVIAAASAAGAVSLWEGPSDARPTRPAADAVRRAPRAILVTDHAGSDMPASMAMPDGISAPERGGLLPAGTRHGLAHRLRDYPDLELASAAQRRTAADLWRRFAAAAQRWSDPRVAARDGFDLRRARRAPGDDRPMWFHSENRRWHADSRFLDVNRPDTLIYLDLPDRPLRLVGVMISMPRGRRGPTPGGVITRWHYHLVCVDHGRRGLAPRRDGSCPRGQVLGQGSEMMHLWFTRDLRSAFAIHAPVPELCSSALLPAAYCDGRTITGM